MRYYRIFSSIDTKEIGEYPQVSLGHSPVNIWDPSFVGNFFIEKTNGKAAVPSGKLNVGSKLTDLLSRAAHGFSLGLLASPALAEIIRVSNYFGVEFYDVMIGSKGKDYQYIFIHPAEINIQAYDFGNSRVVNKVHGGATISEIQIKSYSELQNIAKNPPIGTGIVIDYLVLNPTGYDFFVLSHVDKGGIGWYVSEKLKEAIVRDHCSGIVFKDINELQH